MNDPESSERLERELKAIFTHPDPAPGFVNGLEDRLLARVSSGSPQPPRRAAFQMAGGRRWAIAVAGLLLLLSATVAVLGPQQALAAVRELFAYIPGLGFVENASTARVLEAPIRIEREGLVLTISSAVADAQSTRLDLQAEGQANIADLNAHPEGNNPIYLLLPGGEQLPASGSTSTESDLTHQRVTISAEYAFGPLPADVNEVTLVLPALPGLAQGEAPEDWRVPLHFRQPEKNDALIHATGKQWMSPAYLGFTLVLDRVAQTADGTALRVRMASSDPSKQTAADWWNQLTLTGQGGKIYPLVEEITAESATTDVHTLKTLPLDASEPLTLRLDSLELITSFSRDDTAPGFSFDPGPQPRLGQTWTLDQVIQAGEYRLHLVQAALVPGDEGGYVTSPNGERLNLIGLRFAFASQPGVTEVGLRCARPSPCDGVPSVGTGLDIFVPTLGLSQLPGQPMDIRVQELFTTLPGPWEIHWQAGSPSP